MSSKIWEQQFQYGIRAQSKVLNAWFARTQAFLKLFIDAFLPNTQLTCTCTRVWILFFGHTFSDLRYKHLSIYELNHKLLFDHIIQQSRTFGTTSFNTSESLNKGGSIFLSKVVDESLLYTPLSLHPYLIHATFESMDNPLVSFQYLPKKISNWIVKQIGLSLFLFMLEVPTN